MDMTTGSKHCRARDLNDVITPIVHGVFVNFPAEDNARHHGIELMYRLLVFHAIAPLTSCYINE